MNAHGYAYIGPTPGFSSQLGHLVSMMSYTRQATLKIVSNLTVEQLDYIHDENSNSIGALLLHISAIESVQQVWSFENRELSEEELRNWNIALKLNADGRAKIRGNTCSYYVEKMGEVRERTLQYFLTKDDAWLYQEVPGKTTNQYCRWFHVIEDEISHRGQIKWLLNRAKLHPVTS